jgi:hypothetical protein
MSYSPLLVSSSIGMSLLTGVQAANNASPTAATQSPAWITLPPSTTDGVTFNAPVLFRGVPSALGQTRARIGDFNDQTNYKEQAAMCVYRAGTTDDLLEEVSDDELIFYRSSAAEIKIDIRLQYLSGASYPGLSFDNSETRYLAWRLT